MAKRNLALATTPEIPAIRLTDSERVRLQTLDAALADANTVFQAARAARAKYCAYLEIKYEVGLKDQVDLRTGVITRAKAD